ncbi:MAG: glutathione peroxidase [Candidatus Kapabacteria bacterium]|nr:glutathione peroxidase [Candidatus Kapabacteria bacterium]
MNTSLNDFELRDIDGKMVNLSDYSGKVVVVVNVASFCGYTKQYATLEKLYEAYKDKGLVVLGFPANDFGAQEPGTEEEIKSFCSTKYKVSFPLFSKIVVKGQDKAPLYTWLTSGDGNASLVGEVGWNFEKFLIGKDGKIKGRYKSNVDPMSEAFIKDVESALR